MWQFGRMRSFTNAAAGNAVCTTVAARGTSRCHRIRWNLAVVERGAS
jgi:hypothetical protein